MLRYYNLLIIALVGLFFFFITNKYQTNKSLPLVQIAYLGPHATLEDTIKGIKISLNQNGFVENENIVINTANVNFDSALIPQMISKAISSDPKVLVALTTPVAQYAKSKSKNIPIIFSDITDPIEAGLLKDPTKAYENITGMSDQQNFDLILSFANKIIPNLKSVGVLYSTSEANDLALIKMLKEATAKQQIELVSIPIDQQRDIPQRMQLFKNKVDFIYVGSSGPITPALPIISVEATKMDIPIISFSQEAVIEGMALASFGVDYIKVGVATGNMVAKVLRGEKLINIAPQYPSPKESIGFISKKQAKRFSITIPSNLVNIQVVE